MTTERVTRRDPLGSQTALTRDERARLADRPDWTPVLDRTAAICERLLDDLDARVLLMLETLP